MEYLMLLGFIYSICAIIFSPFAREFARELGWIKEDYSNIYIDKLGYIKAIWIISKEMFIGIVFSFLLCIPATLFAIVIGCLFIGEFYLLFQERIKQEG